MNSNELKELAEKTCSENLEQIFENALSPLNCLLSLAHEDSDINDFLPLLRIILENARGDLEKLAHCLSTHLGEITVNVVKHGAYLEIDGQMCPAGDLVRASLERPVPGIPDPLLDSLVKDPDSQRIILLLANILDFSRKLGWPSMRLEPLKTMIASVHEELKKEFNKQEGARPESHAG